MKNFFTNIINAGSDVSSKRFISLYSLALLTGAIIVSFFGIQVADIVYYVLSGLIAGTQAMTLTQTKNTNG